MNARPNILLPVIECLRSDRVFGANREVITPNIDRRVAEGVSFDTLIAAHGYTPVCVSTLLTGLYPFHHGMRGLVGSQLRAGTPTLPRMLRTVGYTSYMEATGPLLRFWRPCRQTHWCCSPLTTGRCPSPAPFPGSRAAAMLVERGIKAPADHLHTGPPDRHHAHHSGRSGVSGRAGGAHRR
jgi:hypothetical protein